MNNSAVGGGWFASPQVSVSGLALRQWSYKYDGNVASFVYAKKEKINTQRNFFYYTHGLVETEVGV